MPFMHNIPFFSIMLPILCGIICLSVGSAAARRMALAVFAAECALSAALLVYVTGTQESFTYMMGHFPAPFGNEMRAGALEALMALAFSAVMLLSAIGGLEDLRSDIDAKKHNFFYLMTCFQLAAMLAIVYSNDLFTAYVFIEIITLSACSIIVIKEGGKPLIAAMSYLIMSLIGSALLLLSIALLYTLTGQLLMPDLNAGIQGLMQTGDYFVPLFVLMGLMIVGLGIKCAMFPFHSWLPNAHAHATTAASSILSGLIVKCYLLLLVKIFMRVFSLDVITQLRAGFVLIAFGTLGLIIGSVIAVRQRDVKQMLSYSTVAQVGYICIAIGLGNKAGLTAACFHIIVHAAAKSMLFTSAGGLARASGHKKDFISLVGAARRDPASGAAFICGALSMIGIPLFSGFISKLYTSTSSFGTPFEGTVMLALVVISTVLNTMYYAPVVVCILAKRPGGGNSVSEKTTINKKTAAYTISIFAFIAINLTLGVFSQPVFKIIDLGISVFG